MVELLLPRYKPEAIDIRFKDLEIIINTPDLNQLSQILYNCGPESIDVGVLKNWISSEGFTNGADYSASDHNVNAIIELILRINKVALKYGFPKSLNISGGQFDIELARSIWEISEDLGLYFKPADINDINLQSFMTQRIFPLFTFWRWSHGGKINEDRVRASNRNYFYTLLITAWLFDKGKDSHNRWEFLSALSADIIVSIIERPNIGYRREFARAIARQILEKTQEFPKVNIDRVIRGVMKRATFTFSVCVIPDEEEAYNDIVKYLFNWSEKYYVNKD
jgi:hypothetical protein